AVRVAGVLAGLLAAAGRPARPGAEVAVPADGLRLGSGAGPDVAAQRDDPVLEQQPRLACGEAGAARRDQVLPGQSDLPEGGGAGPFGLLGDGLAPLPFDPGRQRCRVDGDAGQPLQIARGPELVVEVVVVLRQIEVDHPLRGQAAVLVLPVAALVPGDAVAAHGHADGPPVRPAVD